MKFEYARFLVNEIRWNGNKNRNENENILLGGAGSFIFTRSLIGLIGQNKRFTNQILIVLDFQGLWVHDFY